MEKNTMPKLKWRHLPYASHGLPVRLPKKLCPDCQQPMAQHFCSCVYRPVYYLCLPCKNVVYM